MSRSTWNTGQKYVEYLNHIEQLFPAGRKKEDVLQAIINLHRSTKRWEEIAREQAKNPVVPVKLLKAVSLSKGGEMALPSRLHRATGGRRAIPSPHRREAVHQQGQHGHHAHGNRDRDACGSRCLIFKRR